VAQVDLHAGDGAADLFGLTDEVVALMGDGIERAIARAGELETLVANEVSALERAYTDNEVRIRALSAAAPSLMFKAS